MTQYIVGFSPSEHKIWGQISYQLDNNAKSAKIVCISNEVRVVGKTISVSLITMALDPLNGFFAPMVKISPNGNP
jgi:hypothetical protein